jgi:hypothetical protein
VIAPDGSSPARISILAIRFLCELGMLAGLAYAGAVLGEGVWSWVLGVGLPLVVAVTWGLFISPKARIRPPLTVRVMIESDVFIATAILLWLADAPVAGVALGVFGLSTSALNAFTERGLGAV